MTDANYYDRIAELLDEAQSLPHGDVQVSLVEAAVNQADMSRDLEFMFDTRMQLVYSGVFSGHSETALTAFAWCLAKYEADPDTFGYHERSILWYFKNILHNCDQFPQIARDKVEELREQMATIYRRTGYNMRPVHYTRLVFATRVGDLETCRESYEKYRSIPRDSMADCLACEADSDFEYFELAGDFERAVEAVVRNLTGRLSCAEVPHRTYSNVLLPLARLGRYEEADTYQAKGYRMIRDNPTFLGQVALQMAYLVHRNRASEALQMFERHLAWALSTFELRCKFMFLLAAHRTLVAVAEEKQRAKLALPTAYPGHEPSGEYDLVKVIEWVDAEHTELGNRFDARNGNRFFTEGMRERFDY